MEGQPRPISPRSRRPAARVLSGSVHDLSTITLSGAVQLRARGTVVDASGVVGDGEVVVEGAQVRIDGRDLVLGVPFLRLTPDQPRALASGPLAATRSGSTASRSLRPPQPSR